MEDMMDVPDQEWKEKLTEEEYRVLRKKETELPFSGTYLDNHETGMYVCKACGFELFASDHKFDSGTGWPSFDRPLDDDSVGTEQDTSLGMVRTEAFCPNCGGHLGHVFPDGPTETGTRYCINSCSLKFKKTEEM